MAFRFIAVNDHPDHDTIATFRRRFLPRIEGLFVQILLLAREAGMLQLGTVALDGTKVHANASRHSALSYGHACKIEAQLKAEVAELMALAEAADGADVPDGMSVPAPEARERGPEELARREVRLARIAEVKAEIEARAKVRHDREQDEYEAKIKAREEKAEKTGCKPGGRPPPQPTPGPGAKDQVNLTDQDSRIMPVAGGGFEQAYNAFSQTNVEACAKAKITPLIALGRERHHLSWKQRFAPAPPAPDHPTALQAMIHRLAPPGGRKTYGLRKQTPEPVFGIIKLVMGLRQFHLRGLDQVKGEWNLVTLAWNMKRMFALQPT